MKSKAEQNLAVLPEGAELCTLERHSFSDEAARKIQKLNPGITIRNVGRIYDVKRAVSDDGVHGLIPIENSPEGLMASNINWIPRYSLNILLDIRHRIKMCAGGIKGGNMDVVQSFYSYHKELDQCSELLCKYPNADQVTMDSTAAAARHVADMEAPHHVVLASRGAIKAAGLEVYKSDVADHCSDCGAENIAQFYVVHRGGNLVLPNPRAKYHAVIMIPKNKRGSLGRILSMVENMRVNLTSLHSLNIGTKKGEKNYSFFFEMDRQGTQKQFRLLSEQLSNDEDVKPIRWLGSWNHRIKD